MESYMVLQQAIWFVQLQYSLVFFSKKKSLGNIQACRIIIRQRISKITSPTIPPRISLRIPCFRRFFQVCLLKISRVPPIIPSGIHPDKHTRSPRRAPWEFLSRIPVLILLETSLSIRPGKHWKIPPVIYPEISVRISPVILLCMLLRLPSEKNPEIPTWFFFFKYSIDSFFNLIKIPQIIEKR